MNEFRAKSQLKADSADPKKLPGLQNMQFSVAESQLSLANLPIKPVKMRNAILGGQDWTV